MSRAREVVRQVVERAERTLTAAEVRHLAKQQDASLDSVLLACAVAEMRRDRRIILAHD